MSGIVYAQPAAQKSLGVVLSAGTSANIPLLCFDKKDQGKLAGLIAEGNTCCNALDTAAKAEFAEAKWYDNRWMWFSFGAVLGVVGVTIPIVFK